ncbi:hypothetical protein EX30DRAFT_337848 [Ascodesmis nigricans]|uniref:Autophagy-related protein 2 n=1 Tax=Ascodesmis nigricans TaxID=341454 RepID=A0A4S2N843_9PEZI|nr:hypothetical protein EX30DRAFT_337848 [Ascodesmis nigricans]
MIGFPAQWDKRIVRWLLHNIDIFEDKTLDDLANISGSVGVSSVFKLHNVGLKVDRLRCYLHLPKRIKLNKAVVSTVTVTVPSTFLGSGAIEIEVNNVQVSAEVSPAPSNGPRTATPTPTMATPRPKSPDEFPHSAMDLAQSFLEDQPQEEVEELKSLYAEKPELSSSLRTDDSSGSSDEEGLGAGFGINLLQLVEGRLKVIGDNAIVRIRGVQCDMKITLPEDRGGKVVVLELELEDVDVEGVSRNVNITKSQSASTRPHKEGKRRITLTNIQGFITTEASMYGISVGSPADSPADSPVNSPVHSPTGSPTGSPCDSFAESLINSALFDTAREMPDMNASVIFDRPPESSTLSSRHTTLQPSPSSLQHTIHQASPSPTPPSPPLRTAHSSRILSPPPPQSGDAAFEPGQSIYEDSEDKFVDYEDSDEEVLAFAPPSVHTHMPRGGLHQSKFMRRSILSNSNLRDLSDDDSDDDADGGATFGHSSQNQALSQSAMSASYSSMASFRSQESLKSPESPQQSPSVSPPEDLFDLTPLAEIPEPSLPPKGPSLIDSDSSDDEMDPEASRLLSQSTIFSKEEADSLYMSATSGLFRSRSNVSLDHIGAEEHPQEEEEIDAEEMDQRLDRLINGDVFGHRSEHNSYRHDNQSTNFREPPPPRQLRRECIHVDILTIYVPSMYDSHRQQEETAASQQPPPEMPQPRRRRESRVRMPGSMPGSMPSESFSMYASQRQGASESFTSPLSSPTSSPVVHRVSPRIKIADAGDVRPGAPDLSSLLSGQKPADIEIIASKFHGTVDIQTEKVFGQIIEAVQTAIKETPDEPNIKQKPHDGSPKRKQSVQLVAEEIDIRLVKQLQGIFVETGEEQIGDPTVQLQVLLNDVKIHQHGLPEDKSSSRLSIKKFSMRDEEQGIITFLAPVPRPPSQSPPAATPANATAKTSFEIDRKRTGPSHSGRGISGSLGGDEDDIFVEYETIGDEAHVKVRTRPIRIRGDLKSLEEKFTVFGRFSSMLASTTASTATVTRPGKPPPWKQGVASVHESGPDLTMDAEIGGFVFDVVGSTATVSLIASPIHVGFKSNEGVSVQIEDIEIGGPDPKEPDAKIAVKNTLIQFASHPSQDDLSRLIELITPSTDSFDDDDILVDTLLRQREQGSVVRISVDHLSTDLLRTDLVDVFKRFGEEIVQVVTASPIVAGDERPGLLTLVKVDNFTSLVKVPAPVGEIQVKLHDVDISHVSAPTLFALAINTTHVLREGEVLVGIGLSRHMFTNEDIDRPMAMVRMVGDEPEPVVKIKLWNVRFEYNVETLMALMKEPSGTTGDELAQDMLQSIVNLPAKTTTPVSENDSMVALGFDVIISDSVVALNPLNLKSKGLFILTNAQIQAALPNGAPISAGMEIKKASMMIIDDVDHLQEPTKGKFASRSRKEVLSDHIAGLASMGYVRVVDISTASASLRVVDDCVDLEIRDDLLLIESCADSTQTLITLFDGLKPPAAETEEIKYCTKVMPIDDMLQSLTEDAFVPHATGGAAEELLMEGEDLPTDLEFVGSFYGSNRSKPTMTPQLLAHQQSLLSSMLSEDNSRTPTLSRHGSGTSSTGSFGSSTGSVFRERVTVLTDEPLVLQENYFFGQNFKGRGKRALNADAIEQATHFPLRVSVRDANVIWNLHDGYDWARTRETITTAVKKVEARAAERRAKTVSFDVEEDDKESVVDDFLFNSIYIGIPSNRDPKELTMGINRAFDDTISESSFAPSTLASDSTRPASSRSRSTAATSYPQRRHATTSKSSSLKKLNLNRSRNHKVQLEIRGVNVDFLMFPKESSDVLSSVELKIKDLKVIDCVPTSTWKTFLTYSWEHGGRETGSDMAKIECLVVKTAPGLAATELVIKVNILPLRLRVDQDTLDFLTRFFEFKDPTASISLNPTESTTPPRPPEPIFIQRVEIGPVPVKLDYKPKKVDYVGLRSGRTTEFMNFFILEGADMTMRHVTLHGVTGFEKMGLLLNDIWMPDIKQTQLGGVLAGVAPVRSLVNLGKGARDLVVVPIREYKKDGRVVRSLQKGVGGFVRTTAGELVRMGAKAAVGTQKILLTTEAMLGASPNSGYTGTYAAVDEHDAALIEFPDDDPTAESPRMISLYASSPLNVAAGLKNAKQSLQKNLMAAKEAAVDGWIEAGEAESVGGKVMAVAGAAPKVILKPMVGVAEATGRVLMGAGNMIDKDERRRGGEKWKRGH